jgi:prevent-host-death family protein
MTMVRSILNLPGGDPMRTIPAGEFKAKCLGLMDEVEATGQAVFITKRGRPVARLAPIADTPSGKESIFGRLRHMGVITGDIVSSEFADEEWDRMFDEKWDRFKKDTAE